MKIVFIGAGNLATNLAKAFKEAGLNILQIYSRTENSAQTLATTIDCPYTINLNDVTFEADCYIFSVKDNVLEQLITTLSKGREQKLFLHTAGSIPLTVFEKSVENYGVFYPMQTFSKQRAVDFKAIPVFIEANKENTLNKIKQLAQKVSEKVIPLSSEARKQLHLAAVFACNFTNHCYAITAQLLEENNLPFSLMLPLIHETADKVDFLHPLDAQTGPAIRYDENIIKKQADLLDKNANLKALYLAMSKDIYTFAVSRKKKEDNNDKL